MELVETAGLIPADSLTPNVQADDNSSYKAPAVNPDPKKNRDWNRHFASMRGPVEKNIHRGFGLIGISDRGQQTNCEGSPPRHSGLGRG
jgi:hypothetical protein